MIEEQKKPASHGKEYEIELSAHFCSIILSRSLEYSFNNITQSISIASFRTLLLDDAIDGINANVEYFAT